jgi:SAM-dependent methyltransferase
MGVAQLMRSYYNAWDGYNNAAAHDKWIIPQALVEATMPHLNRCQYALDAGCGTGLLGRALRVAGYRGLLVGVDIAERRLAQAQNRRIGGRLAYDHARRADLCHLPWRKPRFDAVLSSGVFGLIGSSAVDGLLRVLRPGGVLAVTIGYSWRNETRMNYIAVLYRLGALTRGQLTPLMALDLGSGYANGREDEQYNLIVYQKIA